MNDASVYCSWLTNGLNERVIQRIGDIVALDKPGSPRRKVYVTGKCSVLTARGWMFQMPRGGSSSIGYHK